MSLNLRASQEKVEKHRLEKELYKVDFAGGTSPRLASSEELSSGSVVIIKVDGGTQTDVTSEFSPTSTGVVDGDQTNSAVQFYLGVAATGAQDADDELYLRVTGATADRTMISLHRLVVYELGDVNAP